MRDESLRGSSSGKEIISGPLSPKAAIPQPQGPSQPGTHLLCVSHPVHTGRPRPLAAAPSSRRTSQRKRSCCGRRRTSGTGCWRSCTRQRTASWLPTRPPPRYPGARRGTAHEWLTFSSLSLPVFPSLSLSLPLSLSFTVCAPSPRTLRDHAACRTPPPSPLPRTPPPTPSWKMSWCPCKRNSKALKMNWTNTPRLSKMPRRSWSWRRKRPQM